MFALELLPPLLVFDIALRIELGDLTSLIIALSGPHRQAAPDGFRSQILRAIVAGGDSSSMMPAARGYATGPTVASPIYGAHVHFLTSFREQDLEPVQIAVTPSEGGNSPFLVNDMTRLELVIEHPDPRYHVIRYTATRTPAQPNYTTNIIESSAATGTNTYQISLLNTTTNIPFRQFLANSIALRVFAIQDGAPGESLIIRLAFDFDGLFNFPWYVHTFHCLMFRK